MNKIEMDLLKGEITITCLCVPYYLTVVCYNHFLKMKLKEAVYEVDRKTNKVYYLNKTKTELDEDFY